MNQKWKTDPKLFNAPTEKKGVQIRKKLDYDTTYRKEFLDCDPLRDWESIDRCKWLYDWSLRQIDDVDVSNWTVLDVGSKDAQFPQWLRDSVGILAVGIEYSKPYVKYATERGRPVYYGDACNMTWADNQFTYVFSHHLHGLVSDYMKALQEMFRVSNRYMIALNQVPGNRRKHFSYIDGPQIFNDFVNSVDCNVIYNDYLDTGFGNEEWVIFVEKKLPEGTEIPEADWDSDEAVDVFFKRKK